MFQVKGFKVCALNESSEPLPEPENGQRVSSFAFGPCGAMPPNARGAVMKSRVPHSEGL
jgi:hypothetical protein